MPNTDKNFSGNLLILIISFFGLVGMGCASKATTLITEPASHPHYYPFTEVIGDYHLRLIVDHHDGNMALVFEDFKEQPLKPVDYNMIKGRITFPDNTVKEEIFLSETELCNRYCRRYYSRKYGYPRQRGIFSAQGDWIKTTPKFTLEATVPFKGKDYQLTFEYEAPGGKIPYHRK